MLKFTAQILKLDEKSPITGVVYRKEDMERIIEEFSVNHFEYGQFAEQDGPFRPADVACKVSNMKIDNDRVIADIEIVDSPLGKLCQDLIKNGEKLATAPRIEIDENGNLINLVGVDIIKDERKAFEGNTLNA